jgi:iron complex transport system substrate-binding protein
MFGDWQTSTREFAKVVGEEAAAESFIDDLMVQINQAKDQLSVDGKTVGFLRLWSNTIYSMGVPSCAAYYDINNGLGLEIPKDWPEAIGELPLEALTEINPDYIFIANAEDEAYMAELNKNSVWNSLTAVKEDHLYSIDISALSGGALAAKYGVQVVLDTLSE